jgi:ABC-type glycerol-3-phosphate transport system permease component
MNQKSKIVFRILKWIFLLTVILFTVYPVLYALLGSFKSNYELTLGGSIIPKEWLLSNYTTAFSKGRFAVYTLNSVIVAVTTMFFAMTTSSMAGYLFARHKFPGKKLIMSAYLVFMFISLGAITLYPVYMLLNSIGLAKNLFGLALVMTGGQAANVFLISGFVKSIPKELDEAAYINGYNYFRVFCSIILPLIKPIMGVVALFTFRGAWNDYLTPLIMSIGKPDIQTLTVAVVQLKYSANAAAEWNIMLAGASIALLPVLIVYVFANKQFISGLTAGAVKG